MKLKLLRFISDYFWIIWSHLTPLLLTSLQLCYFQITQDQVIMSHSPLRMFKKFHDKCVLVSGQGPVLEIAKKYPRNLLCLNLQYNLYIYI